MRHLTIMLFATALAGCSSNYAFGPEGGGGTGGSDEGGGGAAAVGGGYVPDGGGGAGGIASGGGGLGGQAPSCEPGHTICDGDFVLTCDGSTYTDPLDCIAEGTDACVAGACEVDLDFRLGFDEGAGAFTVDEAQGLSGQLVNAGWTLAGWDGTAVLFNGTGAVDFGDVLNSVSLPFTIAGWVHVPDGPTGNMTVLATDGEPPYQGAYLLVDMSQGATAVVGYGNAAGTGPAQRHAKRSALAVPRGKWVHVAGVFRLPDDASIYIDGLEAGGSYSGSAQFVAHTAAPLLVGKDLDGAAGMVGSVDEVRVYGRALNDAQVMQLATGIVQ
jgi:hypothetical protein